MQIRRLIMLIILLIILTFLMPIYPAAADGQISAIKTESITLSAANYSVVEGDCLWTIALSAYGDGYAWTRLAKANNLPNPDLIYPGQILKIPR